MLAARALNETPTTASPAEPPPKRTGRISAAAPVAYFTLAMAAVGVAYRLWPDWVVMSLAAHGLCLLLAIIGLALLVPWRRLASRGWRPGLPHVLFALNVIAMIALRHHLYGYVLPPNSESFEEIIRAGLGYDALLHGRAGPLWRVSSSLSAAGLALGGTELTLNDARLFYRLLGDAAIVAVVLAIRQLGVGWLLTSITGWLMATMYPLVVASSSAGAMFIGVSLVPLLLLASLRAGRPGDWDLAWGCFAGILGGLVMFEYAAFKHFLGFCILWVLGTANRHGRPGVFAAFLGGFVLTYAPAIASIFHWGLAAYLERDLFETFLRHRAARDTLLSPIANQNLIATWGLFSGQHAGGIIGRSAVSAIPVSAGIFLLGGSALALIPPLSGFAKGVLATAGLGFAVNTLSTISPDLPRLVPAFPALLIVAAVGWQRAGRRLAPLAMLALARARAPSPVARAVASSAVAGVTTVMLVTTTARNYLIVTHPDFLFDRDYAGYSLCSHVMRLARNGQKILASGPRPFDCYRSPDFQWIAKGRTVEVTDVARFPDPKQIADGTLVLLFGGQAGLMPDNVSEFLDLAVRAQSQSTVRIGYNDAGRMRAVSFCKGCSSR